MTRNELLRKIKLLAAARGLEYKFDKKRGKGSHGTVYVGGLKVIVPDHSDLKKGTLHSILGRLGLTLEDVLES